LSDYLIPPCRVNHFKDDVVTRPGEKSTAPLPFGDEKTVCTDNWMVANSVAKGTINAFQQTGGFVCACHHAIIETLVEMRKSGEL
jgi:hypothetical protein